MSKIISFIKNAKREKEYWENKDTNPLYNKEGVKECALSPDSDEYKELERLVLETRHENYQNYKQARNSLIERIYNLAVVPLICVLSIGGVIFNLFHLEKDKKFRVYHRTIEEFDNEHTYELEEENLLYDSFYSSTTKILEEGKENYYILGSSVNEGQMLKLYVGEGIDSYLLEFTCKDDSLQYSSVSEQNTVFLEKNTEIGETTDEYKKLIVTALDCFYTSDYPADTSKAEVKAILEENEDAIKAILVNTEYIGKEKVHISGFKWGTSFLEAIVFLAGLLNFYLYCFYKKNYQKTLLKEKIPIILTAWGSILHQEREEHISWLNAIRTNNAAFCEAEKNRIKEVQEYLDQYGAEDKILTPFEKKLVKQMTNEGKK